MLVQGIKEVPLSKNGFLDVGSGHFSSDLIEMPFNLLHRISLWLSLPLGYVLLHVTSSFFQVLNYMRDKIIKLMTYYDILSILVEFVDAAKKPISEPLIRKVFLFLIF